MDAVKRSGVFLAVVAILAAGMSVTLFRDYGGEADVAALRVGVGDGIVGLLMEDVAKAAGDTDLDIDLNLFIDCCGSAAQWAMGAGELDVGFYCDSIALTLVNRSDDLEIYGPAVLNCEMVALGRDRDEVGAMAVPMKRAFLSDIVCANFPAVTDILPASTTSLHYALSGGKVDGAVVDVGNAMLAPDFDYIPLSDKDYVSYCLVVSRDVLDTTQFAKFLDVYNQMAEKYNNSEYLTDRYGVSDSFRDAVNVKFLYLN